MADSSIASIITSIAASITALGGLVTVLTVFLPMLKTTRSTHKIVNQQRTDMMNFNRALIRELERHGIQVPIDQSVSDE